MTSSPKKKRQTHAQQGRHRVRTYNPITEDDNVSRADNDSSCLLAGGCVTTRRRLYRWGNKGYRSPWPAQSFADDALHYHAQAFNKRHPRLLPRRVLNGLVYEVYT